MTKHNAGFHPVPRHNVGPGRRLEPEERRALIVSAACDYIAKHGLDRTTVRMIAAECGVSVGAVMYHFPSVDSLLMEALREASARFTRELHSMLPRRQSARDRLLLVLDHALPDRPEALMVWRLWVDYWSRAARDKHLAALEAERYAEMRGLIAGIVAEGIAAGEFRLVDKKVVAAELVALLDGVGLQLMIGDPQMSPRLARKLLHAAAGRCYLIQDSPPS